MYGRNYATFCRSDVGTLMGRVVNVSAPIFCASTTWSRIRARSILNTGLQNRNVSVYAPETDLVKSDKKLWKGNTRVVADHFDLTSFIEYQNAKGASTDTTVALGTRYEYLIQRHLQDKLGFSLTRIGGKGDGGIDLIGTWTIPNISTSTSLNPDLVGLPTASTIFRVLVQAKRLSPHRKPMPSWMRELEGTLESSSSTLSITQAFQHHLLRKREEYTKSSADFSNQIIPPSQLHEAERASSTALPTLAILITTNPLTDGIRKFISSSRSPLMYMCLEETAAAEDSETATPTTSIQQIAWNASAAYAGLEGLDVGMRYADNKTDRSDLSNPGSIHAAREAILIHEGRPVQFASAQVQAPT